ncbi:MAG: leucyl aminopeptidase family protein [Proteobacteria bacterium]|nr:leucyl aminopeptidase family protein [Pseudomonadota bacterium]NOG59691.1 leucyl aminopeptidase family protein [Pseudomonadota bacterium]
MKIKLQQKKTLPTKLNINSISNWLMILAHPLDKTISKESKFPHQTQLLNRRSQLNLKKADSEPVVMDLPNQNSSHVAFAAIESSISSFDLLTLARKMVAEHSTSNPAQLGIVVSGFSDADSERMAEALISAALAASATMPKFKSEKQTAFKLSKLSLFGLHARHGFKQSFATAEGNALTRSLSMLPPNKLTPTEYLKEIKQIARENKWKLDFYDEATLKKKKAGAFLAVSQGSPKADAGIVRLRYTPKTATQGKKVFLVGKGICYDTGGTNLKPANYMFGMHEDMQGSAVALGTLLALSKLNFNRPVECWMALAMNHIGPKAYKPNDVITASDGTTIEIVHTDAEGRMVLSDTLALASKEKPSLILDYATLTGACMYSIGTSYSGVFTNKKEWHEDLIKAGEDSGERVWPFPLDEDFDDMIKSDIADVKQCSQESGVDHILASRFLQRFVKYETPWVHMDLSASNRKGGLAHIPTDTIGFGVRYSVNLLLNNYLR